MRPDAIGKYASDLGNAANLTVRKWRGAAFQDGLIEPINQIHSRE